jgi:hypothetical protein
MKGSAAFLDLVANTVHIAAMGAACAVHLNFWITIVCRKQLKVDTVIAKGLKTSSQVITREGQLCMKGCTDVRNTTVVPK